MVSFCRWPVVVGEITEGGFLARGSHSRGIKWSVWFLVAVRARDQGWKTSENFVEVFRPAHSFGLVPFSNNRSIKKVLTAMGL
jgi:hypothetical protein